MTRGFHRVHVLRRFNGRCADYGRAVPRWAAGGLCLALSVAVLAQDPTLTARLVHTFHLSKEARQVAFSFDAQVLAERFGFREE